MNCCAPGASTHATFNMVTNTKKTRDQCPEKTRGVAAPVRAPQHTSRTPYIHCAKVLLAAGIVRVCFAEAYRLDPEAAELIRLVEVSLEALYGGTESMV